MGSLLLLSPLLLLGATYSGGRSVRGRRAEWVQSPRVSPVSPSGTSAPFWVRLSPELVSVPPGSSVLLNCSSSCPLPENYQLRTQLQQGKMLNGSGWVSYQLLDVRAWSSDVHCFVTCAGEMRSATTRVTAYQLPHSMLLEPPVLEGSEYTLRCHITRVFPVGFLVVSFQHGGRVIYSESLKHFTNVNPANVTLTYMLPSRSPDLWQPVTCHARFNLDGLVVHSSSAPLMLTALAWSTESTALTFTSMAALVILLAVGAAYLMQAQV
ncbi:intercellular adhesion molecule 4 [Dugong dugon]